MPSLTDSGLHLNINFFESQFETDYLAPATVAEYSEDITIEPSITESLNEDFMFYDRITDMTEKTAIIYTYPPQSHSESHDQFVSSPTGSTESAFTEEADLLDLDLESLGTWAQSSYDNSDPDWTPTTVAQETSSTKSPKHTNNKRQKCVLRKAKTSYETLPQTVAKVTKRRNSSLTSELELQIEIEASTKRAKRCTAPLTEEQKRLRRKELNRLAAQRCRSKRKGHGEILEEEIDKLTAKNRELKERLEELESTKTELYDIIKFHFASCHPKSE